MTAWSLEALLAVVVGPRWSLGICLAAVLIIDVGCWAGVAIQRHSGPFWASRVVALALQGMAKGVTATIILFTVTLPDPVLLVGNKAQSSMHCLHAHIMVFPCVAVTAMLACCSFGIYIDKCLHDLPHTQSQMASLQRAAVAYRNP